MFAINLQAQVVVLTFALLALEWQGVKIIGAGQDKYLPAMAPFFGNVCISGCSRKLSSFVNIRVRIWGLEYKKGGKVRSHVLGPSFRLSAPTCYFCFIGQFLHIRLQL